MFISKNFILRLLQFIFLMTVLINAHGQGSQNEQQDQQNDTLNKRHPPEIHIMSVEVVDYKLIDKIKNIFSEKVQASERILIGSGDVFITIKSEDYVKLNDYVQNSGKKPTLFLNGFDMENDAILVSTERTKLGEKLGYYVTPGKSSQVLWAALFRNNKLKKSTELRAGIGWNGTPATSIDSKAQALKNEVQVSDSLSIYISLGAIFALGGIWLYVLFATDTFRDLPSDSRWREAANLQSILLSSKNPDDSLKIYKNTFDPAKSQEYEQYAQFALQQGVFVEGKSDETLFGLAKRREKLRASFSLGRLQFGVWFLFAVMAGIFFWILYGDLPALDGSVLAIVTLSVGVAGMSIAVDAGADRPFKPTQGLLKDLTTGFDDQQKVYRFQAVVVNLLLLFIGIFHVFQQLSYPTFDPTWLAFLGLSGIALAGGKQLTENNNTALQNTAQTSGSTTVAPTTGTQNPAITASINDAVG